MIELIGWVGAVCFAMCGAPQAWLCWRQKHANGVSGGFLALWVVGEVCMLWYSIIKIDSPQILVNYVFNIMCLLIILRYKLKPEG